MPTTERAKTIGIAGLITLLASWTVLLFPWRILPSRYVPNGDPSFLLALLIFLAVSAGIAGIIAGRMTSKWWFVLAGAGFLSAAVLLAGVAV